jgi:hypothetical protein
MVTIKTCAGFQSFRWFMDALMPQSEEDEFQRALYEKKPGIILCLPSYQSMFRSIQWDAKARAWQFPQPASTVLPRAFADTTSAGGEHD